MIANEDCVCGKLNTSRSTPLVSHHQPLSKVAHLVSWSRQRSFTNQSTSVTGDIYSVDFYLPEYSIGIEIDGPSHFICPREEPSGSTLAKRRFLERELAHFFVVTGNTVWKEETSIDETFVKID